MALNKKISCLVFGAGGHARVLLDALQEIESASAVAILDSDARLWGQEMSGVPILGGDDCLGQLRQKGITHFIVGVGSVGDATIRRRLYAKGLEEGLEPLTILHHSVLCSKSVKIGRGSFISAGAILNPGSIIGNNVIINTGAIVEHDCIIEDHVHIAPGVTLSGEVHVQSGAHIGTGASVRQSIVIGEGAMVATGAVVVKDVAPHTMVGGVPAILLKKLEGAVTENDKGRKL